MVYTDYLWSPGRLTWVKDAHQAKGKPFKGCIFCGIAKGDKRVPSKVLYRDDKAMVIMNIFPYNVGHIMVVPIKHVTYPGDMSEEEYAHFNRLFKNSITMLKKALKPVGFNTGINLGSRSGQSISHLHAQIVPRYKKEVGFMESVHGVKVMPETIDATYKRIKKHVDVLEK